MIDNGSDPGWHAGFTHEFPDVVVVRSPRNLGFAGALPATVAHDALGAARSEGALLILNQDAEVGPTCVARLEEALRHPSIGIACPLVLDHHGRIWARGGAIDPITARARNVVPAHAPDPAVLADVDYAPGCALLVRADVWLRAGGFDAGFFMYFEDADLGVRVRRLGYRVVCDPGAACRHAGSSAAGAEYEPFQSYFRLRNRARFVNKNFGLVGRIGFWTAVLPLLIVRDAYRYARRGRWSAFGQVLAGLRTVRDSPQPPATRSDVEASRSSPSDGSRRTGL